MPTGDRGLDADGLDAVVVSFFLVNQQIWADLKKPQRNFSFKNSNA